MRDLCSDFSSQRIPCQLVLLLFEYALEVILPGSMVRTFVFGAESAASLCLNCTGFGSL